MARKISLIKELGKKVEKQSNESNSIKIDVTEESILARIEKIEHFPSITYINTYQVMDRGFVSNLTIDSTEIVEKYPQNKKLIEQFIVGTNAIIKPGQSRRKIRDVVHGLKCFLEFLNSEKNLSNNYVINISDINIIIAKSFSNYLLSVYPKATGKSKWFSAIKQIVERLQELYLKDPSVGKGFVWPKGPGRSEGIIEGYHPREIIELSEACIYDIKNIMELHQKYISLEEELFIEEWNLENLMFFINERWKKLYCVDSLISSRELVGIIIRRCKSAHKFFVESGYTYEQIYDLYRQRGTELALCGRSPFATPIKQIKDQERAELQFNLTLATLKKRLPLFPYYYPIEEAKGLLHYKDSNKDPLWKLINSAVNASCREIKFMNGSLGKMAVYAAKHFTIDTIYPFLLLALINTGWNLESLLSLSDDVDAHITPDMIDPENYVLIHGKKNRGSKDGNPSKVTHRSNIKKRYSTYWLLKYVESIITQYNDSQHYKKGYLWQYTTVERNTNDLIASINEYPSLERVSNGFIKRHRFKYISGENIFHPKIRSGHVALRQLLGSTERELSEYLGHKSEETIIHYISDESSNIVQDLTIKLIQKQFINDIKNFKVRVVESQSLRDLCKAINEAKTEYEKTKLIRMQSNKLGLQEKTIIHILDVGSQKYILVCEDCKKPSWPGFSKYVKEGINCRYFNKCALCKQAIVFPEALPYIARRIIDLKKLQFSLASSEWIFRYGDENDAWNQILDCWSNRKQVENAWELAKTGFVILPQIMRGV